MSWQLRSKVSLIFLESEEGKKAIVALHVEGILNYVEGIRTGNQSINLLCNTNQPKQKSGLISFILQKVC